MKELSGEKMEPLIQALNIPEDVCILYAGAGTGEYFTIPILKALKSAKRYVAFEIREEYLEKLVNNLAREAPFVFPDLILADGFNLPFKNETFDVVFAASYLNTIDDNESTFKELLRVCKSGGKVVSTVSTAWTSDVIHYDGYYPFAGHQRLSELMEKKGTIRRKVFADKFHRTASPGLPDYRFGEMFVRAGLKEVGFIPLPWHKSNSLNSSEKIDSIDYWINRVRRRTKLNDFYQEGMTRKEFAELLHLLRKKKEFITLNPGYKHFGWSAGINLYLTGIKS